MNVQHNPEKRRFFVEVEGKEAELTYQDMGDDVLNYSSTFTPPELRGKGLAGQVTKAALEYAKDNNKKVTPGCPYVATYIERHPEYKSLIPN